LNPNTGALYIHQMKKFQDEDLTPCSSNSSETILAPGRRCGLVVQRANSFTGGRAFDPKPWHPLSHSRDRVLHPSSRIWLAGSVQFSTWLDWFRKIGLLAKNGGGTARTRSTKKKKYLHGCRKQDNSFSRTPSCVFLNSILEEIFARVTLLSNLHQNLTLDCYCSKK
jgi:hypothetical protein